MLYDEQQVNLTTLVNILKNAFFNVSDIEEDRFKIIVDEFPIYIKFDVEKKRIQLSSLDRLKEHTPNLYSELLEAVNTSNRSLINVRSYVEIYEGSIFLTVEQDISYSKGLIIEQFIELLRLFDKIALAVYRNHISSVINNN